MPLTLVLILCEGGSVSLGRVITVLFGFITYTGALAGAAARDAPLLPGSSLRTYVCYISTLFHCELKCTLNSQTHTDKVCLPLYTLSNTRLAIDRGKAGDVRQARIPVPKSYTVDMTTAAPPFF